MTRRCAVFLDRDGTLMRDVGYPRDPAELELLPGVAQALRLLHESGVALVLVSNQSGIGRRLLTDDDLSCVHNCLVQTLAQHGVRLDGICYCPHAPWDQCECRKPRPGLLYRAAAELDLDLTQSFMVGDRLSDVIAGHRAGCRTVLLGAATKPDEMYSTEPDPLPDVVLPDLLTAARWILYQTECR